MNNNISNNSTTKQKRARRKINIIDVLVIILILAIVGVSVYAVISWSHIKSLWSSSTVELQYVVELMRFQKISLE